MFSKPIRVFVFQQVSDAFEPEAMWECDWTQTEQFMQKVFALMKKYQFISLVHRKIGRFTPAQVTYLRDRNLVPVFVDGKDNVKDPAFILRFCIDE